MENALRLIRLAMVWMGCVGVSLAQSVQDIVIGKSEVALPGDWQLVSRNDERVVYRSPDGAEQVTISVLTFQRAPSFDDFKLLCEKRLEVERKVLQDGFVEPEKADPNAIGDKFVMFYSGGDRKTRRIFSGLLSQKNKELLAVYMEGVNVDADRLLANFKEIASSVKRN